MPRNVHNFAVITATTSKQHSTNFSLNLNCAQKSISVTDPRKTMWMFILTNSLKSKFWHASLYLINLQRAIYNILETNTVSFSRIGPILINMHTVCRCTKIKNMDIQINKNKNIEWKHVIAINLCLGYLIYVAILFICHLSLYIFYQLMMAA